MGDVWDDIMQEASLGGVTFPLKSRRVSGGRDGARLSFPHAAGQAVDDTGRQPRSIELTIELYADVDPSHYPGIYRDLIALFEDDARMAEVEYVDPILAPMQAKVWGFSIDEESVTRNGATVTVELEEVTQDVDGAALSPRRATASVASESALELDAALLDAGVTDEEVFDAFGAVGAPVSDAERAEVPPGEVFVSTTRSFMERLRDGAQAADDLAATTDAARRRVSGLTTLPTLRTISGWRAYSSALQLVDALGQLADAAIARAVPVVELAVNADTSAVELSTRLYGTRDRAEEIVRRNPTLRPHAYRAGTVLRVAAR